MLEFFCRIDPGGFEGVVENREQGENENAQKTG